MPIDPKNIEGTEGSLTWLTSIMRALLSPEGCPWDREQTLQTLRGYMLEECYEVLDAIDAGDRGQHAEELGDLLFQIVFQAELGGIALDQVIGGIGNKLIRRHPHVFGAAQVDSSAQVVTRWEEIKAQERREQGKERGPLDGVPRSMPALQRGEQLIARAARTGFDWPGAEAARAKVGEELDEADRAAAADGDAAAREHEIGDLLFAIIAWARKLGVEPERAATAAAERFQGRFTRMHGELGAQGHEIQSLDLDELLEAWRRAR